MHKTKGSKRSLEEKKKKKKKKRYHTDFRHCGNYDEQLKINTMYHTAYFYFFVNKFLDFCVNFLNFHFHFVKKPYVLEENARHF